MFVTSARSTASDRRTFWMTTFCTTLFPFVSLPQALHPLPLRQPGSSIAPGPQSVPSLPDRPRSAPWKLMFFSVVLEFMRNPCRWVRGSPVHVVGPLADAPLHRGSLPQSASFRGTTNHVWLVMFVCCRALSARAWVGRHRTARRHRWHGCRLRHQAAGHAEGSSPGVRHTHPHLLWRQMPAYRGVLVLGSEQRTTRTLLIVGVFGAHNGSICREVKLFHHRENPTRWKQKLSDAAHLRAGDRLVLPTTFCLAPADSRQRDGGLVWCECLGVSARRTCGECGCTKQ